MNLRPQPKGCAPKAYLLATKLSPRVGQFTCCGKDYQLAEITALLEVVSVNESSPTFDLAHAEVGSKPTERMEH